MKDSSLNTKVSNNKSGKVKGNNISFHPDTNLDVIKALNYAKKNKKKIRVYQGDSSTGTDWCIYNDCIGYLENSTGHSTGTLVIILDGHIREIQTEHIVKIQTANIKGPNQLLYQHPNYNIELSLVYSQVEQRYQVLYQGVVIKYSSKIKHKAEKVMEYLNGKVPNGIGYEFYSADIIKKHLM